MTYDAYETSVQDAIRVEIYTFETPTTTYYLTDFDEDVTFDGQTYEAVTIGRGPAPLVPLGKVREVTVSIARDHALAQALRQNGIPPQNAQVTIRRYFLGDTEARTQWRGFIGNTSTDGEYARIRVPNRIDEAFNCQLPALTAQRTCPHMLYDEGCRVDPVAGGFRIAPTVASVDGVTLVVSSMSGKPDGWATDGKVVRVSDGEERDVLDQTGTTLTLAFPFRELEAADALYVFAGCDHTIAGARGCFEKFDNVLNFGGDPEMPIGNPSAPTGYGVRVQE